MAELIGIWLELLNIESDIPREFYSGNALDIGYILDIDGLVGLSLLTSLFDIALINRIDLVLEFVAGLHLDPLRL